jgi:hypothetical protein
MRTLGKFGIIALVILSCWVVSAAEDPKVSFASGQYLEVKLSGHAPVYLRIPNSQKRVILPLGRRDVLPMEIVNERKAGTILIRVYEPAAKGEFDTLRAELEEIASYRLENRLNDAVTLHDLSIFGVQQIQVSVAEKPGDQPILTKCVCPTETCTAKPGKCVECACAICCSTETLPE